MDRLVQRHHLLAPLRGLSTARGGPERQPGAVVAEAGHRGLGHATDRAVMILGEIVSGDRSGGATVSHAIEVPALQRLVGSVPPDARLDEYRRAVLQDNVLAKDT